MENIVNKTEDKKGKWKKSNRNEEVIKNDLKVRVIYESQGRSKRNIERKN